LTNTGTHDPRPAHPAREGHRLVPGPVDRTEG
jgi:hypothetical protein